MVRRPWTVLLWVGPVLIANWLLLAVVDLNRSSGLLETTARLLLAGTLFGNAALAAAWTAFGPTPLVWRLPLSLIWVIMQSVAIAVSLHLNGGPPNDHIFFGAVLLIQWLLLQFPLWAVALGFGVHLRHSGEIDGNSNAVRQFGIRQLVIVTTIMSGVFAVGRVIVPTLVAPQSIGSADIAVFGFLMFTEVVLTLLLLLAALLRRMMVAAVSLALAFICAATFVEVPLLGSLSGFGPRVHEFIAINVGTAGIVLLVVAIVRLNGYSLATTNVTAED